MPPASPPVLSTPQYHLISLGPELSAKGIFAVCDLEMRSPIQLRTTIEGSAFLGALCDARRNVLRWLEIWVQRTHDVPGIPFLRSRLTNAINDERWAQFIRTFEETSPESCVFTGIEGQPSPPAPLDDSRGEQTWSICTNDELLRLAGRPEYSSTEVRHLQRPETEGSLQFVELPMAGSFNPGGGSLFFRKLPSTSLTNLLQLVSSGRMPAEPEHPYNLRSKGEWRHVPDAFLHGWSGDTPPLEEVFFLKTTLISKLLEAAAVVAESLKRPLLNISRNFWGVNLDNSSTFLAAWKAEPVAALGSSTVEWTYSEYEKEPVFFLNPGHVSSSIYCHPQIKPPQIIEHCVVRIRDPREVKGEYGVFRCEGSIQTQDKISSDNQLLILDHPMAEGPIHAHVMNQGASSSSNEVLFQTLPWRAKKETLEGIQAGGYAPPAVTIPLASLPRLGLAADLYSLGVLALEILTCCETNRLSRVHDELLRLARRLEAENVPAEELVRTLVQWSRKASQEDGWLEFLHPRHLTNPPMPAMEAWRAIPEELWFSAIVLCMKMLTGQTRYAWYSSPAEGGVSPAMAFAQARGELLQLATKARGLTLMDWHRSRIIREEILAMLK